ncbi:hypothetical protein [Sinosporangium siamense]|uniref:Uncharacterized protein n=1 Tax=Sinosporangium siamense TaxID=1367973 RepID=A0A919V633_9ACTN|nr:hypothetical protein [Sinosporangium siamense]GII91561.1 hypothetical protein Ssi02_17920 [Sinosporangium siamense]
MTENSASLPPPDVTHDPVEQAHEHVVEQVRDITRGDKTVIEAPAAFGPGRIDTGLRRLIPITYDIVLHEQQPEESGEDK